jgi:predicted membrane-bound mannosyltransferase
LDVTVSVSRGSSVTRSPQRIRQSTAPPATHRDPWLVAGLALIVVLALALRLTALGEKPLHHDEGVNGWLSLRLFWWNLYHYGPRDYHGPLLYYVNLISFWLLGPSEPSLRLP